MSFLRHFGFQRLEPFVHMLPVMALPHTAHSSRGDHDPTLGSLIGGPQLPPRWLLHRNGEHGVFNFRRYPILEIGLAPTELLLDLWCILDDPAVEGGMIHRHSPLLHHLFQLAIRNRVGDVPANPPQNDLLGKVAPFELHLPLSSPLISHSN